MRRGETKKLKQRKVILIGLACLLAVLIVASGLHYLKNRNSVTDEPSSNQQIKEKLVEPEPEPEVKSVNVQPIVDSFVASSSVDYGIEVYDVAAGKVIGKHQPDKQYFTASIYKLYVAYLSLQRMQSGEFTDTADYLGDRTRMGCIHHMIHTSDSPCGEKLMGDITQANMGKELKAFGLMNSPFPGFTTTAHDANMILLRIAQKKELSQANTDFLLEAMNTQIYRNGLPTGFSEAEVYDKVGFNEDINFHDVGIVEFKSGRQYLVSIFSQGQGSSRPMRLLAEQLQPKLLELE